MPDTSVRHILLTQREIQSIVPAAQRPPDHAAVILLEVGEFLLEVAPSVKDWAKAGDPTPDQIDWALAAVELADVVILCARAIVGRFHHTLIEQIDPALSLEDAALYDGGESSLGELLLEATLAAVHGESVTDATASFYHLAQAAQLLPFRTAGLAEAWAAKVETVKARSYRAA